MTIGPGNILQDIHARPRQVGGRVRCALFIASYDRHSYTLRRRAPDRGLFHCERPAMSIVLRWALTLILVAITAFCCFGFLAGGEFKPWGSNAFRLLYGTAVVACVIAIVAVWRVKTREH
jgi:hypothetical protein